MRWPGGLARLASTDPQTRRTAAGELIKLATSDEQSLLTELFGHPDALVRETSLRALQNVGGERANAELVKLLSDPEPNVRAAVLKQLAEQPGSITVKQIAAYIAQEQDLDLIVHAVRLLKEIKHRESVACLVSLFKHQSWQVRAEAVEAVGSLLSEHSEHGSGLSIEGLAPAESAEAYTEIIGALSDADGFVISRAVLALKSADLPIAASPLVKVAEGHPELAQTVAESLMAGQSIRQIATPLLKSWLTHTEPSLRTAALRTLGQANQLDNQIDLIRALSDDNATVRITAVQRLLRVCEQERPRPDNEIDNLVAIDVEPESTASSLLGGLLESLQGKTPPTAEAPPTTEDSDDQPSQVKWLQGFRQGTGRPKWMTEAKVPLQVQLSSSTVEERLVAGIALLALGEGEPVLAELRRIADQQPEQIPGIAAALRWLPWSERATEFARLFTLTSDEHAREVLCRELVVLRDSRASALLWETLENDQVRGEFAQAVLECLQHNHGIEAGMYRGFSSPPKPVGMNRESVRAFAKSPHVWQQRVALAMLVRASDKDVAQIAQSLVGNKELPAEVREDAFRVVLLTSDSRDANQAVVSAILDPASSLQKPAMAYLVMGTAGVNSLGHGEIELLVEQRNPQAKPPLPKQLTPDHVRPFLASDDEETVGQAAYLLAMLGDAQGMEQLITRWRKSRTTDAAWQWQELLVEAIAAGDNPRYVPILAEIYHDLSPKDVYRVRELYWTIRSMHGPEILKLRKKIRDDVGMDQLR